MAEHPDQPHDADGYRRLPEPIRLEDTITSQDVVEAPDPRMGRDTETEWLLKFGAG